MLLDAVKRSQRSQTRLDTTLLLAQMLSDVFRHAFKRSQPLSEISSITITEQFVHGILLNGESIFVPQIVIVEAK